MLSGNDDNPELSRLRLVREANCPRLSGNDDSWRQHSHRQARGADNHPPISCGDERLQQERTRWVRETRRRTVACYDK